MKKNLLLATALLSVTLLSGMALAKTATTAAPATTEKTETTKAAPPAAGKGHEGMGMMHGPQLSPASQKLMQEAMQKAHEGNKELFEQIGTKQNELEEILKAPAFDKDAFLAKTGEIQEIHQKMMRARDEAFASVASQLTAEERASFAGRPMMGPHAGAKKGAGMGAGMKDAAAPAAKAEPAKTGKAE